MPTIAEALRQGTDLLAAATLDVPRLTAEVLLAHALKQDRLYLLTHAQDPLSELAWLHYGRALHQRLQRVPTQYVTGMQEFYGRDFFVSPAVLIPRPETEFLVEAALDAGALANRILDLGTGSGAIAITLSLELQRPVIAVDLSPDALQIAARNGVALEADVHFVRGDLVTAFAPESIDVVVSNPPYISEPEWNGLQPEVRDHEPRLALVGGPRGDEIYARLVAQAQAVLRRDGHLLLELGHTSEAAVRALLDRFHAIEVRNDYAGIPRVIHARKR